MATTKKTPVSAKKLPTVTVETKKITSNKDCCDVSTDCCKKESKCHLIGGILLVINTILLVAIFLGQTKFESMRVGGSENYKLLKQVYTSEGYKTQQKQQIEQAIQMFNTTTQAVDQTQQAPAQDMQVQQVQ